MKKIKNKTPQIKDRGNPWKEDDEPVAKVYLSANGLFCEVDESKIRKFGPDISPLKPSKNNPSDNAS